MNNAPADDGGDSAYSARNMQHVTTEDLRRLANDYRDLADPIVMTAAWRRTCAATSD
jgi:hypothetical protein